MLADKVNAIFADQIVQQKTMTMEYEEYRDFLAGELDTVLHGPLAASKPPAPPVYSNDGPEYSTITDSAARGVLENAPLEIRQAYGKARRNGETAADALSTALALLQQMREVAEFSQINN